MKITGRNIRGFTVVELMIVAVLVAVLAAIATISFIYAREKTTEKLVGINMGRLKRYFTQVMAFEDANIANLSEAAIEALLMPDYLEEMPDCSSGDYSTDGSGHVHCSAHGSTSS